MYFNNIKKLSSNFYVCSPYDYSNFGLYDVEYFYIINRFNSTNFKLYEVVELENGKKYVYGRNLLDNKMFRIIIPKIKKIYVSEDKYNWYKVYTWKTKKGIRKYVTSYDLYNRNEHRYYHIGDINKYGHKLIRISSERFYSHSYEKLKYVGLNIYKNI